MLDLGKWEKFLPLPLKSSEVFKLCRANCVYASASTPPQHSLGCESQRLEVSGPGRCKVFEKACGGRRREGRWERVISCVIFTRNHRISTQSGKCAGKCH